MQRRYLIVIFSCAFAFHCASYVNKSRQEEYEALATTPIDAAVSMSENPRLSAQEPGPLFAAAKTAVLSPESVPKLGETAEDLGKEEEQQQQIVTKRVVDVAQNPGGHNNVTVDKSAAALQCLDHSVGLKMLDESPGMEERRRASLCTQPSEMGIRKSSCARTVALASFEGSGNHFARFLLEQSSGILTGSKFGDVEHWQRLGATIKRADVMDLDKKRLSIATKTHLTPLRGEGPLGQRIKPGHAIVVVRDPRGALLANYNRIGCFLPKSYFGMKRLAKRRAKNKAVAQSVQRAETQGSDASQHASVVDDWDTQARQDHFDWYISHEISKWEKDVLLWTQAKEWKPKLIVKYEDMQYNTDATIRKMLEFTGIPIEGLVEERIQCLQSRSSAMARSKGKYNPWTTERSLRITTLTKTINSTMASLGYGFEFRA